MASKKGNESAEDFMGKGGSGNESSVAWVRL
jgi:hypothetical protein